MKIDNNHNLSFKSANIDAVTREILTKKHGVKSGDLNRILDSVKDTRYWDLNIFSDKLKSGLPDIQASLVKKSNGLTWVNPISAKSYSENAVSLNLFFPWMDVASDEPVNKILRYENSERAKEVYLELSKKPEDTVLGKLSFYARMVKFIDEATAYAEGIGKGDKPSATISNDSLKNLAEKYKVEIG